MTARRRASTQVLSRLWDHGHLLIDVVKTPILLSVTIVGNGILLVGSSCFYWVEHDVNPAVRTYFDAVWWAFSTVTTVGFGDVVPVTLLGRIIAICMMVGGVASFVSFTALLVAIVTARAAGEIMGIEAREARHLEKIADELASIQERLRNIEAERNR